MSDDLSVLVRTLRAEAESASSDADGVLSRVLYPASRSRGRTMLVVAASVVMVLALALGGYRFIHRSSHDRPSAAAQRQASIRAEIAHSPIRGDYSLVNFATGDRAITYRATVTNVSVKDVVVDGPIQARDATGEPVTVVAAVFTEAPDTGGSSDGPPPAATTLIPSTQAIDLWIRIRIDCADDAPSRWTGGYPVVLIPLRGHQEPAAVKFDTLNDFTGGTELSFPLLATRMCSPH